MLIAIYFYLRLSVDVWLLRGRNCPGWKADLALLPLILSCFGSYWATEGAKKNDRPQMLTGMIANLALAFCSSRCGGRMAQFQFRLVKTSGLVNLFHTNNSDTEA